MERSVAGRAWWFAARGRVAGGTDLGRHRAVNEDGLAIGDAIALVVDGCGCDDAHLLLADAIDGAASLAEALRAGGEALRRTGRPGVGATAIAARLDGDLATIAHCGDCRAYRWRAGALERLTRDHDLARAGADLAALPAHYARVITSALGLTEEPAIDTTVVTLAPGERLVLCTDGVHRQLDDVALAALLGEREPERAIAAVLAAAAVTGHDNATVAILG
jgi:protein phosphatase